MASDTLRDSLWVEQFRAGDDHAFRRLVEIYAPQVYRFLYRLTGNDSLADELTQEVFVRVCDKLDTFETGRPFRPWLLRIASNRAISHFRRENRLVSLDTLNEEHAGLDPMDSSQATDPVFQADARISAEAVMAALSQLPPRYRQVLLLRYQEDLSYEAMAQVMATPLNTVRTWLRRARQTLRRHLQEQEHS